jgi:hypothetical protein
MSETLWWLVVILGVFLIGLTKSGFGSGVGLFVVPLLTLAMGHTARGSEAAPGLMLPLLILGDIIAVWQYRDLFLPVHASADAPAEQPHGMTGPSLIRHLALGTIAGVVLGGLLLWWFHKQGELMAALIRLEIGFECLLLLSIHYYRQWRGMQTRLLPEPARGTLSGAFAGVSSTLAHAAGPIIAMYLLPLKPPRKLFVGTCALYFGLLNTAKLPAYYWAGMFSRIDAPLVGKMTPMVLLGAAVGFSLNRHMSDKLFTQIIYAATLVLGLYLLWDGASKVLAWM